RQRCPFGLQGLKVLEPTLSFDTIFSGIVIETLIPSLSTRSRVVGTVYLNKRASAYSIIDRICEILTFIKDIVKRHRNDTVLRLDFGFLVSDTSPSEAAYSRMITIISESNVLEEVQEILIHQAITEGFITDDTVAIDATHFEAKDQAPPKEEQPKIEPKKRGRKSKEEREQWMIEKAEREANLPFLKRKLKIN